MNPRARSSDWIERWSPKPKVGRSSRLGRIAKATFKWPFFIGLEHIVFIQHSLKIWGQKLRLGANGENMPLYKFRSSNNVFSVPVIVMIVCGGHVHVRKLYRCHLQTSDLSQLLTDSSPKRMETGRPCDPLH